MDLSETFSPEVSPPSKHCPRGRYVEKKLPQNCFVCAILLTISAKAFEEKFGCYVSVRARIWSRLRQPKHFPLLHILVLFKTSSLSDKERREAAPLLFFRPKAKKF